MTGSQEYYGKTAEVRRNDYLTDATDYEGENHSILAGVIRLLDEIPNGEYDVSGWSHDVGAMCFYGFYRYGEHISDLPVAVAFGQQF